MTDSGKKNLRPAAMRLSRRSMLNGLGVLAMMPVAQRLSWAQAPAATDAAVAPLALPLKLESLINHIGISVPDVIKSATFYSRVVGGNNVNGEKSPSLRYFINFNPGSVAIGKLGTLGAVGKTVPLIDHYCVTAAPFNDAAWRARLKAEGLMYVAQGVFLDIDNIPIQVAGAQGGESLSAGEVTKLPPLYTAEPLLHSSGYDHVLLRVKDVDRTAAFYKKMFGLPGTRENDVAWVSDGDLRVGLRKLAAGEEPGIERYAIRTAPFDAAKLSKELTALGAKVGEHDRSKKIFRFADPDGIKVELRPA